MYRAPIDPIITAQLSDPGSELFGFYAADMEKDGVASFSYEQNANVFAFVYGDRNGCACRVKRNRDGLWSVTVAAPDAERN